VKQSDLRALIDLGADLDAPLPNGRTLVLDLLVEEVQELRGAVGLQVIYGFHGLALDAAIALLAAGADPDSCVRECPTGFDDHRGSEQYPPGMCAVHFVPLLCTEEWPGPDSTRQLAVFPKPRGKYHRMDAVEMARKLAEALSKAGADFAARNEPRYGWTACHAALVLCEGADEPEETEDWKEMSADWCRAAGKHSFAILSRFCDHSRCMYDDPEDDSDDSDAAADPALLVEAEKPAAAAATARKKKKKSKGRGK
jgi:hypothetical protein